MSHSTSSLQTHRSHYGRDETPLPELSKLLGERMREVVLALVPDAPKAGRSSHEWRMGSAFGGVGTSTVINMHQGLWCDHNPAGDGAGDALAFVALHVGGIGQAAKWAREFLGLTGGRSSFNYVQRKDVANIADVEQSCRREWVTNTVRQTFASSKDPRGTLVQDYLTMARGLPDVLDETTTLTLRFHPESIFKSDDGSYRKAPALIAAFRNIPATIIRFKQGGSLDRIEHELLSDPERIVALQRTELSALGQKINRTMLGPVKDAAIFISGPADFVIYNSLTISEGVETGLSAYRRGFKSVVALGSAGAIDRFQPIEGVSALTILAENDAASMAACSSCVNRWTAAGRLVTVIKPTRGTDLNDLDKRL